MAIKIGPKTFYTPGEVGEILHLNAVTVRNLMRAGRLPAHKFGGRWYISEDKLSAAFSGDWQPERPDEPAGEGE